MSKLTKGILISLGTVAVATFAVISAGVYCMMNESSDELIKKGEDFLNRFKNKSKDSEPTDEGDGES